MNNGNLIFVNNDCFSIDLDVENQQCHIVLKGDWTKEGTAISYKKHITDALTCLKPGFTILVDISNFKLPSITSLEYLKQVQEKCIKAGMKKSAEIIPQSTYTQLAINRIKERNKLGEIKRKSFTSKKEAESWLTAN